MYVLWVNVLYWCIPPAVKNCCRKHYSKSFLLWFLSCRTSSEIDDKAVESFVDEDDFIISLDYNDKDGVCSIVLETSSWRMVSGFFCLVLYFTEMKDIVCKLNLCIFYWSSLQVMSTRKIHLTFSCSSVQQWK